MIVNKIKRFIDKENGGRFSPTATPLSALEVDPWPDYGRK
jgi:hypothetical protein